MKVILKQDIQNLGRNGEIKTVKDGYARNYLLPRGLVETATEGAMRAYKNSEAKRARRSAAEGEALQALARRLEGITLSFSRPVSEEGVLFGSVAKSDLIKNLAAADVKVAKEMIRLPASLKAVGTFEVEIALRHDIVAKVKVAVTAQSK